MPSSSVYNERSEGGGDTVTRGTSPFIAAFGLVVMVSAGAQEARGIYIVPQSHIDVAWDWRYDPETIEVCVPETFGRAIRNIERFPDFSFSMSQAPLYEALRKHHPDLAARVEREIRSGRWEVVGGHWVEFEGTGPGGEALVRQFLYGERYFKETYGIEIRNAWQADSWSHPATLPQILAKCEIDAYVFERGSLGESIFWWESADGSRVLAVHPFFEGGFYNDLNGAIKHHEEWKRKYGIDISMWRYGKGDHGGGMDEERVAELKKQMERSPIPLKFSRADAFLDDLRGLGKSDWPVLRGELGFELEGCHSNTGRIKVANRRAENLLVEAETFSSIASRTTGFSYPREKLKAAWLAVLTNQFHDVISGSLVPAACEDALEVYARAERAALEVRRDALESLTRLIDTRGVGIPVVVFNPLPWPRTGPVEVTLDLPEKPEGLLFASGGSETPGQVLASLRGSAGWEVRCLFMAADVPGIGYRTWWARSPGGPVSRQETVTVRVEPWKIENGSFVVRFDPKTGDLSGILDKGRGIEVIPEGSRANEIVILEDTGSTEGEIELSGKRWSPEPLESRNGWKVIESGPVRTTVRIRNKLPHWAAVDRFVTLHPGKDVPWIQFRTHFEWNDVNRFVKIAFPTPYRSAKPVYDIPYGTIVREASGEERPAIQWVDLGDASGGVGILNDCRYGHDVREGTIRLSALRSTIKHAVNTESGNQELTYALYPHGADWRGAEVVRRGFEFNHPLIRLSAEAHEGRRPASGAFVTVGAPIVVLTVIKRAEDGDRLVARMYETNGEAGSARLELSGLGIRKASVTNLLERHAKELHVEAEGKDARIIVPFGPAEIVTIEMWSE